jgi:Autographiviridae endonuclease VII
MAQIGFTPKDYKRVHAEQNGVCAICGKPETARNQFKVRRLSIDHDHTTNKFRGLLCNDCNIGLGRFHDSPQLLSSALRYVVRFSEQAE